MVKDLRQWDWNRSIGNYSVIMAELLTIHDMWLQAWRLGYKKIVVETDIVEVVRIINQESNSLRDNAIVEAIKALLQQAWEVKLVKYCEKGI
ncbi:hypothetical protein V6N11_076803 [Hibiscus sabdariffa]|uniref:RNase H type-1 domain-containing protein n=2 Tax=Hibiscus sabdariffa TaxID=183260 RepID=A0ABR2ATB0_9ROSI